MGFPGACWRKGLVRDSPRQRLDGCGLAVAPCSADAGRDDGAGVPGESEGFGLRLWVWRLRVTGSADDTVCSGAEGRLARRRLYRLCRGRCRGQAVGARSGRSRLVTSGVGFGRGRRLRVGHGGCGGRLCRRETRRQGRLLCRRRSVAFQTEAATVGFVASRRSGQRGGVGWARQGIGQRRGRGVVSFAQSCSEICGQRRNGRLGGDDFRLASYVFDEMSARKEMGKRREGWGAGPLAGGV
ncbi:hypothetical protein OsJ_26444 [Oryza sativa Japonica Group]|uniref:Uncharacterized protein n=1 Tax=Oryza sativa subsp. japonica TaxID=39947 RepID=B9FZM6_ORYSJ|nr:hypothetical protein OsJ_26444 [Oryza sativa Japonica Group]